MTLAAASDANSQENWDAIWAAEGEDTWRTYPRMYGRVLQLVPQGAAVLDIGCGVGKLLDRLKAEKDCVTCGTDISEVACAAARAKGHQAWPLRIAPDTLHQLDLAPIDCVVAVEFLEHLDDASIGALLARVAAHGKRAIFAVPNNCLGPDVEPQHKQQWTALQFKQLLEGHFETVRVECVDDGAPRLIGVCGFPPKPYKLAFTMPVKNEAADLERVLKSFRGACDVMVIGVDDKSTDETYEIAGRYADDVFFFTWENHFAKARNVCIERCRTHLDDEGDWIFMSEGHEHLEAGLDELLNLGQVPSKIHVVNVIREDREHAWTFPWLFRNRPEIIFENAAHNALAWDDAHSQDSDIPAIRTWHAPSHENRVERAVQRKAMNRQALIKRLAEDPSDTRSCYYLANEWRRENNERAIEYYRRYLSMRGKNKPERYQARLSLAECLLKQVQGIENVLKQEGERSSERARQQRLMQEAYDVLIIASAEDWSRCEHWLYLGDLCFEQGDRLEQALRFFELAATSIDRRPLTFMWIQKSNYSWIPAMRLVTAYAAAGMLPEALRWCERVNELMPEWTSPEARNEVERHRQTIIEKIEEVRS